MKTAVISDLHANREAVAAVMEHAEQQNVDRFALLGDFVGYGADPGWVVDWAREMVGGGALAVLGNHDHATVLGVSPSMREEPRRVIEWTRNQLDDHQLDFLASLPLTMRRRESLFVHANAWAPADWMYVFGRDEAQRSLDAACERLTFCGHMHEPRLYFQSPGGRAGDFVPRAGMPIPLLPARQWLVIPGSAGQPRDGDPAACYAVHDDGDETLTYWRVPYDHASAAAKIRAAGLPEVLADRLAHGV